MRERERERYEDQQNSSDNRPLIRCRFDPPIPSTRSTNAPNLGRCENCPSVHAPNKQVTLVGSGYVPSQVYYIWVMGPKENRTTYSGTSFTAISTGLIPPGGGLPLSANSTLGTYLITFQIRQPLTHRRQERISESGEPQSPSINARSFSSILGGGLFPGVNAKLSIRNSAGDYVNTATVATDVKGNFNYTWRIPEDSVTDAV